MLNAGNWTPNQQNSILFVLVDSSGAEVIGLGSSFTLQISKAGAAFATGAGAKSEVGLGWYRYVSTAAEADTPGPVAIVVSHASTIQQNLEYVVADRVVTAVSFTYTLTSDEGGNPPIAGAEVYIATDSGGANIVWQGQTDNFGVARDGFGNLPRLQPGTYYFFRYKYGWSFENPDTEVVG